MPHVQEKKPAQAAEASRTPATDDGRAVQPKETGYAAQRAALSPVQRKANAPSDASVHEAAERGTAGGGAALPHLSKIQAAFGRHDVSGVQAYTGPAAAEASGAMGAQAYATGNKVAFAGSPDLHTAAHEAAHVVQQRGGVSLKGGVGQAGDTYEQHADRVADLVVQGKSAEAALAPYAGTDAGTKQAVQRKVTLESDTSGKAEMRAGRSLDFSRSIQMTYVPPTFASFGISLQTMGTARAGGAQPFSSGQQFRASARVEAGLGRPNIASLGIEGALTAKLQQSVGSDASVGLLEGTLGGKVSLKAAVGPNDWLTGRLTLANATIATLKGITYTPTDGWDVGGVEIELNWPYAIKKWIDKIRAWEEWLHKNNHRLLPWPEFKLVDATLEDLEKAFLRVQDAMTRKLDATEDRASRVHGKKYATLRNEILGWTADIEERIETIGGWSSIRADYSSGERELATESAGELRQKVEAHVDPLALKNSGEGGRRAGGRQITMADIKADMEVMDTRLDKFVNDDGFGVVIYGQLARGEPINSVARMLGVRDL